MMTQNQPEQTDTQPPSSLAQLAGFIEQRKWQKSQLQLNKKNSLSKNKKISIKNQQKTEIFKIFDHLNQQLIEGHTVFEITLDEDNQQHIQQWMTALIDQRWASLISHTGTAYYTPIVIQTLSNSNNQTVYVCWLHRHWYAEQALAKQLMAMAARRVEALTQTTNQRGGLANAKQQLAIDKSSQHALSIIIGGPGTGKTFTVAQLVTTLQQAHDAKRLDDPNLPPLSITLTAPTGKAAQRMQESLQKSLQDEDISLDNAKTLHRLLGIGSDGIPRYHHKNPLPDDLIIVDEASMLGLELASQLVDAIKPTGRLILLGDANQLAAVDAGSVLADLCDVASLQPYITELTESKRFDDQSIVGQFAKAIGQNLPAAQQLKTVYKLLQIIDLKNKKTNSLLSQDLPLPTCSTQKIPFYPINHASQLSAMTRQLSQPYQRFFALMQDWYRQPLNIFEADNRKGLFEVFDSYRILCAGHQGQLGTKSVNHTMSLAYTAFAKITRTRAYFYHGLPIIIQSNDYQLGLFNGDIAICLLYQGQLYACFAEKVIPIQRLSRECCDYAYAMTIHKSQGSEFANVAICIDRAHTRLLSQALIYTAVTRSKSSLSIYSPMASLEIAVTQKAVRQTGLQLQFAQ